MVRLGCMQALSSFSCHTISFQVAAKSVRVSVSCRLVIWICTFLFVYIIVNGLLTFAESCLCFYIRRFQIFKLKKLSIFAWLIFVFLVHCVSFVKHQSSRQFFGKNESIKPFFSGFFSSKFWNLPALEFAYFGKEKKNTDYDCFNGNGPTGKIPTKKEPIR